MRYKAVKKWPSGKLAICLQALCIFTISPSAYALDLLQSVTQGQQYDADFQSANFEYQSILESRPQIKSALLPQINLDIFYTKSKQEVRNSSRPALIPNDSYDVDTDGYQLSLNQAIYQHGLYLKLEQADLNIAKASVEFEAQKQALLLRIAKAYFDVLAARDNIKFTGSEKQAIEQQLNQAQQRFNAGLNAITDVKEAQARYDIAIANEIAAQNQLTIAKEALQLQIGEMPSPLNSLSDKIPLLSPEPDNMGEWVLTASQNNPALKAAQYALQTAQKQVDISNADHYPSLGLSAQRSFSSPNNSSFVVRDSIDTSVTLNLNIPIYSGGNTSAKKRQAISNKSKAQAQLNKIKRQTTQQCRNSFLGIRSSIARVRALKRALESTQIAYQATQTGFDAGIRTSVEVLTALQSQYRAEKDYAQARYDYIIQLLGLKQAAGILSMSDIKQINQWLE